MTADRDDKRRRWSRGPFATTVQLRLQAAPLGEDGFPQTVWRNSRELWEPIIEWDRRAGEARFCGLWERVDGRASYLPDGYKRSQKGVVNQAAGEVEGERALDGRVERRPV
jgi:hypothetical protein